jgi:hypothetical protein
VQRCKEDWCLCRERDQCVGESDDVQESNDCGGIVMLMHVMIRRGGSGDYAG